MVGLSIIIPFYEEHAHIEETVSKIQEAIIFLGVGPGEVLIINDGSKAFFLPELEVGSHGWEMKVINLPHQGRFQTRLDGANLAKYQKLLFCDSRVRISKYSLQAIWPETLETNGQSQNGWVVIPEKSPLVSCFWEGLSRIFWWKAFVSLQSRIALNRKNYHQYPKGTGLFLVDKVVFQEVCTDLGSFFSDSSKSSDDTLLISGILDRTGLILNKQLSATYIPRHSLESLYRNGFLRGYHGIDSFFHNVNRFSVFLSLVIIFPFISTLIAMFSLKYLLLLFLLVLVAFLFYTILRRVPLRFILSLVLLLPLIFTSYYAGLWYGLYLLKSSHRWSAK